MVTRTVTSCWLHRVSLRPCFSCSRLQTRDRRYEISMYSIVPLTTVPRPPHPSLGAYGCRLQAETLGGFGQTQGQPAQVLSGHAELCQVTHCPFCKGKHSVAIVQPFWQLSLRARYLCSDCPISKLIDAFNSSRDDLSNGVL